VTVRKVIGIRYGKPRGQRGESEMIEVCRGTAVMAGMWRVLIVGDVHDCELIAHT
jgi:hypothetical protein